MTRNRAPIAVLISGNGSNLQAIIDHCEQLSNGVEDQNSPLPQICIVISNQKNAYGVIRAQQAGIPTCVVNHKDYTSRESFDRALADIIESRRADLIVLAGFMRIFSRFFCDRFKHRIMNIHPALLPKYPGLDTHERVIAAGDRQHGASVHFVTAELDAGPVIVQGRIKVEADDNVESLRQKVLRQEHRIYPLAIDWFIHNRLSIKEHKVLLDGKVRTEQGLNAA